MPQFMLILRLLWLTGDHAHAATAFEAALQCPVTEPERRLLEERLRACRVEEPPPAL